jgi:catechol 2,3-dioxygenase-like lactoylglutathione lyase family enzyme
MKPRISIITIGVDDLKRALRFYRDGLGFLTPKVTPLSSRSVDFTLVSRMTPALCRR